MFPLLEVDMSLDPIRQCSEVVQTRGHGEDECLTEVEVPHWASRSRILRSRSTSRFTLDRNSASWRTRSISLWSASMMS